MSFNSVKSYLEQYSLSDRATEFSVSSATVELAAQAIGCDENQIAKTMSFKVGNNAVLIVLSGDVKVDNSKFKAQFGTKAVMLKPDELVEMTGHPMGGVCPFDYNPNATVYLDNSIKRFEYVYPACGTPNSVVKLTPDELLLASHAVSFVDVSKPR